jgi:hypothetical protein
VTGTAFIKRNRKFTALKFPKIGPIVLLVKVVWWQGRLLECKVGKVRGVEYRSTEQRSKPELVG